MNFDDAYKLMRDGAAIARPGWKSIDYLFWGREYVWAKYKAGRVTPFWWFTGALADANDWFVVEVESLPVLPPLKPAPQLVKRPRENSAERRARRQAEMRARYSEALND
jgi:hypothetical protein